jgi:flagellar biosynthesis protein FlhG
VNVPDARDSADQDDSDSDGESPAPKGAAPRASESGSLKERASLVPGAPPPPLGTWSVPAAPLATPLPSAALASGPDEPLRRLSEFTPDELALPTRPLRVIVVGGARGGAGKTMLAANLGLYLATIGRKVVLCDADPAGANLHTMLGTTPPTSVSRLRRAARFDPIKSVRASLAEAMQDSPFRGLRLLHLGFDEAAAGIARGERVTRLMTGLRELDAEYVVVDLGVGVSKEMLDNYLAADLALFVTLPEPTAMENTYRFLRGAFARYLIHGASGEAKAEFERRLRALGGAPSPLDLWLELAEEGQPLSDAVREAMERFRPHIVINQTRLRTDLELGFSMLSAARRRLGITIDYVGHIDHDDTVWTCVRSRRPLLLEVPGAKSSRKIEKIARHLLMLDAGKGSSPRAVSVPQNSHHDLLEIERGASDEEVRRAYKRCREVYAHDSLCCYGLFEPHEIEKLRARLDEAFDVLADPGRRRPYELSVFSEEPEAVPNDPRPQSEDDPPRPPPEITADTMFTGALLRHVRESQRVSLLEVNQRTKVSPLYLKALEDDDFSKLPEVVYTNGFLREFARCLKLDPQQVSRTYLSRYKHYLQEKERGFARKA